jgi:hypothetical protein
LNQPSKLPLSTLEKTEAAADPMVLTQKGLVVADFVLLSLKKGGIIPKDKDRKDLVSSSASKNRLLLRKKFDKPMQKKNTLKGVFLLQKGSCQWGMS